MPPQPGMFALPYASTHKSRHSMMQDSQLANAETSSAYHNSLASSNHLGSKHGAEETKKDRRRKEIAGKLGKEMHERRDDGRRFAETVVGLHAISVELSIRPQDSTAYALRLYPITLERSALLAQLACEEMYALEGVRTAWEEERERIEDEWKKGQEKVRERLLEGIEERRRKAREEKDGEGILDASLDSQSRPLITRKLRNKMAASPPPSSYVPNQVSTVLTNTIIPSPNPNSLSVDELPSPFPLPLLSSLLPNGYGGSNARRKTKGSTVQPQALTGLGKAITQLSSGKEGDIESDLGEIRRGVKRRRTAVNTHKT